MIGFSENSLSERTNRKREKDHFSRVSSSFSSFYPWVISCSQEGVLYQSIIPFLLKAVQEFLSRVFFFFSRSCCQDWKSHLRSQQKYRVSVRFASLSLKKGIWKVLTRLDTLESVAKKEEKDENSSQQFLSKKKQCKKERIIITRLLNLSERLKQRTFELKVRGKHTTKRRKRVSKTELQSSLCRETVIESGISWRFLSFACEINVPVFQMKGKRGYSVSSSCAASARFRLRFSLRFRAWPFVSSLDTRKKKEEDN